MRRPIDGGDTASSPGQLQGIGARSTPRNDDGTSVKDTARLRELCEGLEKRGRGMAELPGSIGVLKASLPILLP